VHSTTTNRLRGIQQQSKMRARQRRLIWTRPSTVPYSRRQLFGERRHGSLARCGVAVRSANCSCTRRVAKTPAGPTTPFARQVAASSAPLLRMRFLWTGYLSARHDFWPRPLSVGTHPSVTTCKANTEKTPRFLRIREMSMPWSAGHDRASATRPAPPLPPNRAPVFGVGQLVTTRATLRRDCRPSALVGQNELIA